MPGISIYGNDVEAIYNAVVFAVDAAREGEGLSLIECKTYRVDSHCMVLDIPRDPDEEAAWAKKDPLLRYEARLLKEKVLNKFALEEIKQEVNAIIDKAETFAKESPLPEKEPLFEELYA